MSGRIVNAPRVLRWQDEIGSVAARWKEQYYHAGKWGRLALGDPERIYARLCALNAKTATVSDVDKIIGTGGWASFWCNGCHDYAETAIELGDPPGYESATVTLCPRCFDAAAALRKAIE